MWAEGALIGEKKVTVIPSRWLTGGPPFLAVDVGRMNPIFVDEIWLESPGRNTCCGSAVESHEKRNISPASTVNSTVELLAVHRKEAKCSQEHLDFTLDMKRAEHQMHEIEVSRRTRCYGRAITAVLALIFFLVTVIAVSMFYTRGKKFFGSL